MSSLRGPLRRLATAIAAVGLAALLAACGSSASKPKQSVSEAPATAPAAPMRRSPAGPSGHAHKMTAKPVRGTGRLPAPRPGTFIAQWQPPHSKGKVVIEQFSLRDGHPLGAIARLPGRGTNVSPPRPGPRGEVWMTASAGPYLRSDSAGGSPAPNSCSGSVLRLAPGARTPQQVLTFPGPILMSGVVPSPDGGSIALRAGGCSTSFSNMHLLIIDPRSGHQVAIGAEATPCHRLSTPAWSANGSRLIFAYGPSRLPHDTKFVPHGTCRSPRPSGLAIVSAGHSSEIEASALIPPQHGCSYQSAAFDGHGIAAVEGCEGGPGRRARFPGSFLGPSYLLRLNARHRVVWRHALKPGCDGCHLAYDRRNGSVIVTEQQAQQPGASEEGSEWVWRLHGRHLHLIARYRPEGDANLIAVPW